MADCCDPRPYSTVFSAKGAEKSLRGYRKKGLDARAKAFVDHLRDCAVEGASILEVGGGVGEVEVELLKAGAASAINVELSTAYDVSAARLADEEGLEGRMIRRIGDFADLASDLDEADIVILNRVVCCYPFMERLVSAAAAKSRRHLALVFPRDRLWTRTSFWFLNGWMKLTGSSFRVFVHDVEEIESVPARRGMRVAHRSHDYFWQTVVFES